MTNEDPTIESHTIIVPDELAGQRLDAFLASRFANRSRVQIRRVINAADASVDGKRRKAAYHLRGGEKIEIRFTEGEQSEGPRAENIPLEVLFEDDHIIAIDKPSGMVVHPSKGHWSGTLTAALLHHFENLSSAGGGNRPGIVHRLDRDTSGVILVAKHDEAHLKLAKQFELRTVEKEYLAICRGKIDRDRDTIKAPIGIHPYQREKMTIRADHSTSREATTFFEVIERLGRFVVIRVMPKTGRTHQIRVHLSHIGCPILCDPLYVGRSHLTNGELTGDHNDRSVVLSRLALHARRIRFKHPISDQPMEFAADIPAELNSAIERIRAVKNKT